MKKMINPGKGVKRSNRLNAYTIQYDDGFWQDIKNVINWYDANVPLYRWQILRGVLVCRIT